MLWHHTNNHLTWEQIFTVIEAPNLVQVINHPAVSNLSETLPNSLNGLIQNDWATFFLHFLPSCLFPLSPCECCVSPTQTYIWCDKLVNNYIKKKKKIRIRSRWNTFSSLSVNYSDWRSVVLDMTTTAAISEKSHEAVWQSHLVGSYTTCLDISTDWVIMFAGSRESH